ncbi:MAG: OsmC family protein [Desulfitobacterium sp.]
MQVTVTHIKELHFEGEGGSRLRTQIDSSVTAGGSGYGSSPMELVLMALAGCSGMDCVTILDKMQIAYDRFQITVVGERAAEHPRIFTDIELTYEFWGSNLPNDRIMRAIQLSLEKYCSVANIIDKAANLTYKLETYPI